MSSLSLKQFKLFFKDHIVRQFNFFSLTVQITKQFNLFNKDHIKHFILFYTRTIMISPKCDPNSKVHLHAPSWHDILTCLTIA